MHTIIDHGFTIFATRAKAEKLVEANGKADPDTEYKIEVRTGGGFVVAMYEDGGFVMCL